MRNITFDFLGQHRHGSAFHEYLRLRKTFFVDGLDWDIPHNDDVEMDHEAAAQDSGLALAVGLRRVRVELGTAVLFTEEVELGPETTTVHLGQKGAR